MPLTEEQLNELKSNPDEIAKLKATLGIEIPAEKKPDDNTDDLSDFMKNLTPEQREYVKKLRGENAERRITNQKIKDELQALRDKASKEEEEKLKEQGKYKELNELSSKKLTELQSELELTKKNLEKYQKEAEEERKAALRKLPENYQDVYKTASLQQINAMVEILGKNTAEHSAGSQGNQGGEPTTFDGLTIEQIGELSVRNPALYNKLISGK
jgi:gas vesicle protein